MTNSHSHAIICDGCDMIEHNMSQWIYYKFVVALGSSDDCGRILLYLLVVAGRRSVFFFGENGNFIHEWTFQFFVSCPMARVKFLSSQQSVVASHHFVFVQSRNCVRSYGILPESHDPRVHIDRKSIYIRRAISTNRQKKKSTSMASTGCGVNNKWAINKKDIG